MQKEKLIIKNFGPIKEVDLDLGKFTILIGEQATGKSTVAKVLAVCRYFSYIVEGESTVLMWDTFFTGLKAWGLFEYIKDSTIFYSCKHYSLNYSYSKDVPETHQNEWDDEPTEYTRDYHSLDLTPLSQEFMNLLKELDKIKPTNNSLRWTIPISFFLNDVKAVMDNPFYLPTERGLQSIFSLGQGSIPNLANFLFNYYSKVDGILKSFKTETEIEPLNIIYLNRNGIGYIRKKNEQEFYLLANAASGYQSTIPAILVIRYYELKKRKKTFIIEEPELNLFPAAQDNVMQYLVQKIIAHNNSILLTTHSPYVVTSVNNMMYAYQTGQKNPEQVADIIDQKYWLNPDEVSAYRLLSNGTTRNILDDELKQINAGEIDEISRSINDKWDKIADIDFSKA